MQRICRLTCTRALAEAHQILDFPINVLHPIEASGEPTMKKFEGINYQFRPENYWNNSTIQQAILRGVKGTKRRQLIAETLAEGKFETLGDELKSAEISDELRHRPGRVHPNSMGGEYLPSYERDETEIARFELQSTTADVISIRARFWQGRIHYRVVDEYNEHFEVKPATSRRPFTLQQLVKFINDVSHPNLSHPFSLAYNEYNAEGYDSRQSLRHFTSISSHSYPQLSDHFEQVFAEWVLEGKEEEKRLAEEEAEGAAKMLRLQEESYQRWKRKPAVRKLNSMGYELNRPEDLGLCGVDAYSRVDLNALRLLGTLGFKAPDDWWYKPIQNQDTASLKALCHIADPNTCFKKHTWTTVYTADTPLTLALKVGWKEGAHILIQCGASTDCVIQSYAPHSGATYHDIDALLKSVGLDVVGVNAKTEGRPRGSASTSASS
jgi:hypothetical protein